jgi:hypothetical protein
LEIVLIKAMKYDVSPNSKYFPEKRHFKAFILFYFILFYFVKVLKGTLTLKLRRQPMDRYKNNQDPPPQEFPQFLNYLKQTCSVVVLF